MWWIWLLVIWVIFGIVCAFIAGDKGRSVVAWLIVGFLFGAIGFLIILCLPSIEDGNKTEEEYINEIKHEEWTCTKCGTKNDRNASYCKECGQIILENGYYCPKCDTLNDVNAKFCKSCGYKLIDENKNNT